MHIICLEPLEDGVYNDHNSYNITAPPEGWAYIPEDFLLPSTFPRLGSLEAKEIKGVMTVTAMTKGVSPEPVPEEITTEDILLEMAADHEYRISLIEMDVSDLEM